MAETWLTVIPERGSGWGIPTADMSILTQLTANARAALDKVKDKGSRTSVDVADCNLKMEALKDRMRYMKAHYFLKPGLKDPDFVALLLPIPDQIKTAVPPPSGFAEADVSYPGVGVLELHCRPVAGQPPLDRRSDFGYRIYYGVYPPGGASVEQATGKLRLLMNPPTNGDELPHSRWGRRAKERFDFNGCSGMTAYFCIRYENSKGEAGPWGPLFSAIIP
jgi:hypothetical protein